MKEVIELDGDITLKLDRELARDLDLYDHEHAYEVTQNGKVIGSVSCWEDGTMDYFDRRKSKDTKISRLSEVQDLVLEDEHLAQEIQEVVFGLIDDLEQEVRNGGCTLKEFEEIIETESLMDYVRNEAPEEADILGESKVRAIVAEERKSGLAFIEIQKG